MCTRSSTRPIDAGSLGEGTPAATAVLAFSAEMANCLADTIGADHLYQGL
jgi:hypothetical protein